MVSVVRHHLAMQAQDFGPAKWSIGQRLGKVVDADVERKVSDGSVLRTHVMRPTWHFVAKQDLRWLMALTGARVHRGLQSRYRGLGLDPKTIARAEKLIVSNLEGGNYLTRKEIGEILRKSRVDPAGQRLPHLLGHCELQALICSGPVRAKEQTYALFDERVPKGRTFDPEAAVVELVHRYLQSHGPATLKDMSWWSGLPMGDLRNGLEGLGSAVTSESVDGMTLWQTTDPPPKARNRKRVHLLHTYDEYVVGYTESRYVGDPYAERLRASFKDRRLTRTVLAGSRTVGHWRSVARGPRLEVEVELFERLRPSDAEALEAAVTELGRFMSKEVRRL